MKRQLILSTECVTNAWIVVLLVQPERLLLFQLMVLDQHFSGKSAVANILLCTQVFFDDRSRDIVNESDETFNVKFELIHTMVSQLPVDAGPDRWIHIGELLHLFKELAVRVAECLPASILTQKDSFGAFPYLHILKPMLEDS